MIRMVDSPWLRLVTWCSRWMSAAQALRDPDAAQFAQAIAKVLAMRLVEPDQGSAQNAIGILRAGQKVSGKKICRRGRQVRKKFRTL